MPRPSLHDCAPARTRASIAAAALLSAMGLGLLFGSLATPLIGAAASTPSATTLNPVADAYVNAGSGGTNYGESTQLRVDGSPVLRSYLRFLVPSGNVTKATLRVYARSASSAGYTVRPVADNTWGELSLTYANAPGRGASAGGSGAFGANVWTSVDVSPLVGQASSVSLALDAVNDTAISLASREAGALAPQLVLEMAGSAATTTPTATRYPATSTGTPTATNTPTAATRTTTPTSTPGGSQPAGPIRAAFFYPWFANAWTQGGVFPFTNYVPSLGYYDSKDDTTIDRQLVLAKQAHLDAFIASWWGQGHHTDTALRYILGRSERAGSPNPALRWAVYYENESLGDPTVAQLTSDLNYLTANVFSHPSYLRVGGKPVVFVYADGADGAGMANRWAQAKAALGGNIYLVLKVYAGYRTDPNQPDSWHQYAPAVGYDVQAPYAAAASPGFWLKNQPVRLIRDAVRFENDVKRVVASGAFWQLITTWNEWGEGTSVEPAAEWGNQYADILCRNLPGAEPCGGTPSTVTPTATPTRTPTAGTPTRTPTATATGVADRSPVIAAAGDIACDPASSSFNGGAGTASNCAQRRTSDLILSRNAAAVLPLGDLQYEEGTLAQFHGSYDPSWGRVKAITRPAVGNHEYLTAGAAGYFDYFGAVAGDRTKGYYAYDVGSWRLYAINSNCSKVGGCGVGSPQEAWLRADLAANPRSCTLAYWHHPRWSSGQHGSQTSMGPIFQALFDANAEVVLSGHDHDYERFAPQNPAGGTDNARGVRQFIVGTGGKNHYPFPGGPIANSQVRNADTYGVLFLTLRPDGYDWDFTPESGATFRDSGSTACH